MTEYRKSYWNTALNAALLVLAGIAIDVWLLFEKWAALSSWSGRMLVAWWTGSLILLCCEAVAVLVLSGALISLRRDSFENRGIPYIGRGREWHGSFVVRAIRALLRGLRGFWGRRPGQLDLRAGELVEIRTREEILATLDSIGERDSLPFMPEMEQWCGRQARVFRRVDKIWDWIDESGLRRMRDTVILDGLRCSGNYHGGCQADCPVLWKEAWLRRVSAKKEKVIAKVKDSAARVDLRQFTERVNPDSHEARYVCQLTNLPEATTQTSWHNPFNYLRELLSGNVSLRPFLVLISLVFFNAAQRRCNRSLFPNRTPSQLQKTPRAVLNLQKGELVRIKSKPEIAQTLDSSFRNRGLWFDVDMARFCGGEYRVRERVQRQIEERTGKMITFGSPCITLEGVTATGEYFEFAPLDERIYWREIWLERATGNETNNASLEDQSCCVPGKER